MKKEKYQMVLSVVVLDHGIGKKKTKKKTKTKNKKKNTFISSHEKRLLSADNSEVQ